VIHNTYEYEMSDLGLSLATEMLPYSLFRKGKVVRRGKRGPQKAPTKKLVSLRLSAEVVDHFKSTGRGWQTRIDSTLLESIKKRA
jgi:uncharacterized protein (DUF4415 family)